MTSNSFGAAPLAGLTRRHLLGATGTVVLAGWLPEAPAQTQATEVALAGFAYAGDAASLAQRFPYSTAYERAIKAAGKPAFMRLREGFAAQPPQNLKLVLQLDELKGRDQAVAVALVVSSETLSVEQFGGITKLLALVRAQVLFFDFKSMTVLRAYPISFGRPIVLRNAPTEADMREAIRGVYEGAEGKPGIFDRFVATVAAARLPNAASRNLGVKSVTVRPEALALLPPELTRTPAQTETWAADIVAEALSTRAAVPIVPYAKGYAVGNVMSMRVADGDVFNLKLPAPDYEIAVELTGMKKAKFGEVAAGASWLYGAYASVKIVEPVSGKTYLDTPLKNGEVKVVPASQTYVDDFPAYYDAINGLFVKLARAVNNDDDGNTWIKAASSQPDIAKQLNTTRELVKLCK